VKILKKIGDLMFVEKVSIVIPCYNMASYINQAVDSALAQTYFNIEVIVVNDGSTDASLFILQQYGSRIVLVNQKNQGLGTARNRGIAESKGRFILPLDADDWISPDYLAKTVPLMADPQVGVVATDMQYFGLRQDLIKTLGFTLAIEMRSNQIPACSLIRSTAYAQTPGYVQERITYEDWNLWIDILKLGWKVAYVPEPLFHYRIREASMISTSHGQENDLIRKVRSFHPELNWGSL
jgi:glycosyltransferase involved in cell wall biosynthesis